MRSSPIPWKRDVAIIVTSGAYTNELLYVPSRYGCTRGETKARLKPVELLRYGHAMPATSYSYNIIDEHKWSRVLVMVIN